MKRIKIAAILPDKTEKNTFKLTIESLGGEMERYEEYIIPKESDVLDDHSMDALLHALKDTANGAWMMLKGFAMMAKWSFIIMWTGLRWLWINGLGSKDDRPKQK